MRSFQATAKTERQHSGCRHRCWAARDRAAAASSYAPSRRNNVRGRKRIALDSVARSGVQFGSVTKPAARMLMPDGAILVTGAAGLIGNAVRVLLEADGRAVTPLDLNASTEEGRPLTVASVNDIHRLHAVAAAAPLHGIIHCAAHSGPMVARDNPFDIVQVNVLGAANVLEV